MPLNLKISPEAKMRIREVADDKSAQLGSECVPCLCWISSSLNRGRIPSQPIIGLYADRAEVEKDIEILDGIEIVVALPDDALHHFEGMTLDYRGGQWFLR
jgi:hypothetical protein